MNARSSLFFKLVFAVFMIFCIYMILRLQLRFNSLNDQRKELKQQVDDLKYRNEELQNELDEEIDEDYMIKVAREKLDYHMPDEIIYYNDLN